MSPKSLLAVFIAFHSLTVCIAQPEHAWVRVKAENGMESKIDTIHFVISDGYTSRTVYAMPNDSGVFLADFDISNSIDILWGYKRNQALPLIITPNDTLQITIISEKDGILFGKRARTCANLIEMYSAKRPPIQVYEKEYKNDPNEFVTFMNDRLNNQLVFVNKFCKSQKCTKTFVTWYLKSAYVSYYRNLADYCNSFQQKSLTGLSDRNSFLRARDVILKNIDLNDPTLEMSSGYYDLLRSIFYLYVSPDELRSLYYVTASSVLLQRGNMTSNDKRTLQRIQSGSFADNDLTTLSRLSERYKREINSAVWNDIDPSVQKKLDQIKDRDIRKVITSYYKGIRNWI